MYFIFSKLFDFKTRGESAVNAATLNVLAHPYESTGRAIAITPASALASALLKC